MNRILSLFAIFITIFFFILTSILGLIIHSIGDSTKPIFWLLVTLFMGMFIAFLVCLTNIRTTVKIGENNAMKRSEDSTSLTTCPDYWTKQIVHNEKTNETVVMCYNLFNNDKENGVLIDGGLTKIDTGDELDYSFDNKQFDSNQNHPLSFYRNLVKERKINLVAEPIVETFNSDTNIYGEYKRGHPEYNKFMHYHNNIQVVVGDEISTDNLSISPHSHIYNDIGPRVHSHGAGFDENDNFYKNQYKYTITNSNFDNWINPRDIHMSNNETKTAIEINLNKLNMTMNPCELAKLFSWSEATSKCMN
jgi:hypothetical protein